MNKTQQPMPAQVKPVQVKPVQQDAVQQTTPQTEAPQKEAPQRRAEAHDDGPLRSLGEAVGEVVTGSNSDEGTRLEGVTERPAGSTPKPTAKP